MAGIQASHPGQPPREQAHGRDVQREDDERAVADVAQHAAQARATRDDVPRHGGNRPAAQHHHHEEHGRGGRVDVVDVPRHHQRGRPHRDGQGGNHPPAVRQFAPAHPVAKRVERGHQERGGAHAQVPARERQQHRHRHTGGTPRQRGAAHQR